MKLKSTKTSLYNLLSKYEKIPQMSKTEFKKAFGGRSYWLRWTDKEKDCKAFLCTVLGSTVLFVKKIHFDYDDNRHILRDVYTPTIEELTKQNMIEI